MSHLQSRCVSCGTIFQSKGPQELCRSCSAASQDGKEAQEGKAQSKRTNRRRHKEIWKSGMVRLSPIIAVLVLAAWVGPLEKRFSMSPLETLSACFAVSICIGGILLVLGALYSILNSKRNTGNSKVYMHIDVDGDDTNDFTFGG